MDKRFCFTLCCVAVMLAVAGVEAEAALLNQGLKLDTTPPNDPVVQLLQDGSIELLLKGDGNTQAGVLEVGDTLESFSEFIWLNSRQLSNSIGSDYELTAHSRIKIESMTQVFGDATPADASDDLYDIVFESGFADEKTSMKFYESNTAALDNFARDDFSAGLPDPNGSVELPWDSAGVPLGVKQRSIDGTEIFSFGFDTAKTSDLDFWEALSAPIDLSVFKTILQSDVVGGEFGFAQSLIANPGGVLIDEDGMTSTIKGTTHDFIGSGELYGIKNLETPGDAYDKVRVEWAAVPEPSTLALLCVGAVGFLTYARRRRKH